MRVFTKLYYYDLCYYYSFYYLTALSFYLHHRKLTTYLLQVLREHFPLVA